ncbi:ferrous iron transporter B [Candidatus Altiarchaeales archaeon WOR_SM1_SCG]|nr:ferrous iron transporter B [Candidatus Altiarchaeales archaeon WOR_SM1_SCG]
MKVLLVGNPNVGKSVIFNRLTGIDVIISNYPGTTVDFTKGSIKIEDKIYELIDVPGTYSLEPSCRAEEVANEMISEMGKDDLIINVIDATNLERNLYLTLELLETGKPMIVALNIWDDTKHRGIEIDVKKLQEFLGVPVVKTSGLSGFGIKNLVEQIKEAQNPKIHEHTKSERWKDVGTIILEVQTITHRHHTIIEKIQDLTVAPLTGIPLAILILFLTFTVVRFIGETLIGYVTEPFFEKFYLPLMEFLSNFLGPGYARDILIGQLIEGKIEFMESMGVLTTGVFVPFGAVLPYIIAFYFTLSLLEDSGYLPRLSIIVDSIFHRLGMHGYGIVPTLLGLGCNVPGALGIRTMETRKQKFIAATLLAIAVPCMAQTAMLIGLFGISNFNYIYFVFGILFMIYIIVGSIMNIFVKGESPEILLEIPPYRRPSLNSLFKKLWMRTRWFLTEAVPWLFFGILLVNILEIFGILKFIGNLSSPVIVGLFGLPSAAVGALIVGFLRKDLAVGMLVPLVASGEMSVMQLVIASVILIIYFPCAATFTTLFKELGARDMALSVMIMIATVLIVGTVLRILLIGF